MALPFAPCQTFIGSNKLSCTNLVVACCFRPCPFEVDSRLLTNWLSDVLNGVRGQGELIFTLRDTIQLNKAKSSCTSVRSLKDLSKRCLGFFTEKALIRSRFLFAPHDDFFDFAISKSSSSSFGSVTKLTCCDEFSSSSEDSSCKGCCSCLPVASIAAMCVGLLTVRDEK